MYNSDIRVANTATPSFTTKVNVGGFGWTNVEQGQYNQLIQYVNECRQIWLNLEDQVLYINSLIGKVENVEAQVKYIEEAVALVEGISQQISFDVTYIRNVYQEIKGVRDYIEITYTDFSGKYGDFLNKYSEVLDSAASAHVSEVGAKEWYDKSYEIYLDLKEGQVYRGTWNPNTGAYPDSAGTNSVWDVVLNEGQVTVSFGGFDWRNSDRLLYIVNSTPNWQQISTGGGVDSINGLTGAVTITSESLNAVNRSGDVMSGTLMWTSDKNYIKLDNTDMHVAATSTGGKVVLVGEADPVAQVGGQNYNIFHTNYPPSASQVGAIPLDTKIQTSLSGQNRAAIEAKDEAAYFYRISEDPSTRQHEYLAIKGDSSLEFRQASGTSYNDYKIYHTGFKPTAADVGLGSVNNTADSAKNVLSATKLTTPRTIGGVSFDGTANINLPGVNTIGNQDTSGNAATATKLTTARTINGISFDGTANITVADSTKVPTSRTVNGKALTGDITLSATDVGAATSQDIADSSVPFPDVWIPFNDSLRMLAGYGDDIKVGDYTVATQASFSRASTATYIDKSGVLRTAAINEPRFEKEGLLIEGQSTNLVPWSDKLQPFAGSRLATRDAVNVVNPLLGSSSAVTEVYQKSNSDSSTSYLTLSLDGTYTMSLKLKVTPDWPANAALRLYFIKSAGGAACGCNFNPVTGALTGHVSGYIAANAIRVGEWWEVSVTVRVASYGDTYVYFGFSSFHYDIGSSLLHICHMQLEALPFATSYIPTNGAAATRAGDFCNIACANNDAIRNHTVALEVDSERGGKEYGWVLQGRYTSISFTPGNKVRGWDFAASLVAALKNSHYQGVLCSRLGDSNRSIFVEGSLLTSSNAGVSEPSNMFPGLQNTLNIGYFSNSYHLYGHIRNLRIWHSALTDAQIKGLK